MHGPIGCRDLIYDAQEHCLKEDDYLIILGDFGLVFAQEKTATEAHLLNILNNQPWTTLFIDGNHENFTRLWDKKTFPDVPFGNSIASKIHDKIFYLHRGLVYTIENKTFLTIGGAESIDKEYRKSKISWWKEEAITLQDIKTALVNLKQYNNKVDYVLTHTCPIEIVPYCFKYILPGFNKSCEKLSRLQKKISFKKWYFGHFHIDSSRESYRKFPDNFEALYNDIIKLEDK